MSALPPKADMCGATRDVRYGPRADIRILFSATMDWENLTVWSQHISCSHRIACCRDKTILLTGKVIPFGLSAGCLSGLWSNNAKQCFGLAFKCNKTKAMPNRRQRRALRNSSGIDQSLLPGSIVTSALPPKATSNASLGDVRFVPIADIGRLKLLTTFEEQVRPC